MKTLLSLFVLATVTVCFLVTVQPACVSSAQIKQNGMTCAGKEVSTSLLEQVALDLFTKNFAALEALGVQDGMAFVNCLVSTSVTTHATPVETGSGAKAAAPSPVVVNGNEWLTTHPGKS